MKKLVGAYGNKGEGREREIIPIPEGMDVKAIMARFDCSYLTARASLKRGYHIVDYLKRSICPGPIDPEGGYRMAWYVYQRKLKGKLPWYIEARDVVQEGVVMLLEMAGHPRFKERKFQYYVALNGMKGFIERQRRLRGARIGPEETPGYEEVYRENAGAAWLADWQAERYEVGWASGSGGSPDTWRKSTAATARVVKRIAKKGLTPLTHPGWLHDLGKEENKTGHLGAAPQNGPGQNHTEALTMYQHDTELTEKFARENPGTLAKARENLTIHIPVYRFRCPQCGVKFSIPKDSFTGRSIAAGERPSCGDCALHRGGNCRLVLINESGA